MFQLYKATKSHIHPIISRSLPNFELNLKGWNIIVYAASSQTVDFISYLSPWLSFCIQQFTFHEISIQLDSLNSNIECRNKQRFSHLLDLLIKAALFKTGWLFWFCIPHMDAQEWTVSWLCLFCLGSFRHLSSYHKIIFSWLASAVWPKLHPCALALR